MAEYLTHRSKQGETWDILAFEYYGDELLASIILGANRAYRHFIKLPAGLTLIVPVIESTQRAESLPPWRR